MQHLFVEYELALKLKEAGFTGACAAFYDYKGKLHPNVQEAGVCVLEFKAHEFADYDPDDMVFINFDPNTIEDTEDVAAPIHQQVFDWLEAKGLDIQCRRTEGGYVCIIHDFKHYMMYPIGEKNKMMTNFESRKQACHTAIERALEILKASA